MLSKVLSRPASEISFIPFRDGGALFYPGIQRLWVLNHLAAYIWLSLDEDTSKAALVSNLSENFSINPEIAELDLAKILEHFKDEGLLDAHDSHGPTQPDTEKEIDFLLSEGQQLDHLKYSEAVANCLIDTNGFSCQIYFPDASLCKEFQRLYHYFIVAESKTIKQKIFILASESQSDKFEIYLNEQCVHKDISSIQLYSLIHFIFFSNCAKYLSKQGKLMFHAAALQKEGKTIVLPANSGSGKSTLAIALSSRGWRCFTDELAVLDPEELTIKPLPIPVRIRSGSFTPLLPFYPNIPELQTYEDLNQNKIRWIILPKENLAAADSTGTPITTLIFPRYTEKTTTKLLPLDKSIALERLSATGSSEREMTLDDAKAMVRLIEQTPCYELIFSDLQEAISAIESI